MAMGDNGPIKRREERLAACAEALRPRLTDHLRENGAQRIDITEVVNLLAPQAASDGWTVAEVRETIAMLADEIQGRMAADLRKVDPAIEHPNGYLTRH